MKVYVVVCEGYSDSHVVGVYTTEERAKEVSEQNLYFYYEEVVVEE
jgi:hypothetical protein